jgi:predicted MFS family arabinose efflux permease
MEKDLKIANVSVRRQINLVLEFGASLVSYLGILGASAIPTILMKDLSINLSEFALYNIAFIVALLLWSLPVGLLAHRYGGKKIVSFGLVIIAISNMAFGSSATYQGQLAARVILGIGACSWWVSAPENIVFTFGKSKAPLPLAIWLSGYATGQAISYPLTVLGATTIGWRPTYQIFGVVCLLLAALYILFVKIPSSRKNSIVDPGVTSSNKPPAVFSSSFKEFLSIIRERSTILLCIAVFFQYLAWVGVLTFFPLYLVSRRI